MLIYVIGPWVARTSRGTILAGVHIRGLCYKPSVPQVSAAVRLSNPEILDWIYSTTGK